MQVLVQKICSPVCDDFASLQIGLHLLFGVGFFLKVFLVLSSVSRQA
jgi:hypothetical protein